MFRKLRNRQILINVSITGVVLLVVFSCIYIIYTRSANNRPPMMDEYSHSIMTDDMENYIEISIKHERELAARDLLIMLIVSGVVVECIVALVSYYLAEEAIKPVKEAYESQRLFIANASHEIKTPLAAISANLEAADIRGNKWIKNVEIETAKLTALNNELLNLARTDIVRTTKSEEANVSELVQKTSDGFEPRMTGKHFVRKIDKDIVSKINRDDFSQILSILLDNAVKYSDKKITLVLKEHELSVENDGATIDSKDLEHVFERFYQTDKSAEGVGLGLSIAKSLASRNNWKIQVFSNKLTKFVLNF